MRNSSSSPKLRTRQYICARLYRPASATRQSGSNAGNAAIRVLAALLLRVHLAGLAKCTWPSKFLQSSKPGQPARFVQSTWWRPCVRPACSGQCTASSLIADVAQARRFGHSQSGFTLIELLIALTIFTFISAATFVAMRSAFDSYSSFSRTGERESELQSTLAILTQDLLQMTPRVVRGTAGDYLPAFSLRQGQYLLEFSRSGLPTESTVSGLQRVAYDYADGSLARYSWTYMDRLPTTGMVETVLLSGIKKIEIQVIDDALDVQNSWPPTLTEDQQGALILLPQAIEIRITVKEGEFERFVPGVSNVFFGVEDEARRRYLEEQASN